MIRRLFVLLTITFERPSNDLRITFERTLEDYSFLKEVLPQVLNEKMTSNLKNPDHMDCYYLACFWIEKQICLQLSPLLINSPS
jgi:hypothetical protein